MAEIRQHGAMVELVNDLDDPQIAFGKGIVSPPDPSTDLVFYSGGVERARIKTNGTGTGLIGGSLSVVYAEDYGVVADWNGSTGTDNTTAFKAALAALPAIGGKIVLPYGGLCYMASGIDFTTLGRDQGIKIQGSGGAMSPSTGTRDDETTQTTGLVFAQNLASGIGLDFGNGRTNIQAHGVVLEDMALIEQGDGVTNTLLRARVMNHGTLRNVLVRGGAIGFQLDSEKASFGGSLSGGDASWWRIDQCRFAKATIGMDVPYSGGFLMTGGSMFGTTSGTSIRIRGGAQHRIVGVKFDNGLYCIDTQGSNTAIIGCGFEAFTGTGILLDGNATNAQNGLNHRVTSCYFTPTGGVGATAISVSASCTDAQLLGNSYTAGSYTRVADSGKQTRRIDQDGFFPARTAYAPTSAATLLTTDVDVARFDLTNASNAAGKTCKLPTVSGASLAGKEISVKKTDSSANVLTVQGNASETINGAATFTLTGQYAEKKLRCDGTNWEIVSTNGIA